MARVYRRFSPCSDLTEGVTDKQTVRRYWKAARSCLPNELTPSSVLCRPDTLVLENLRDACAYLRITADRQAYNQVLRRNVLRHALEHVSYIR